MLAVFFVKEINLVVKDFDADQDRSLLVAAAAEGLHLASLWILQIYVLVIVVQVIILRVNLVEEEWQEDEVVVEVLEKVLVNLVEVEGCCWCLHVVL